MYLSIREARNLIEGLIAEGMCADKDEAAHFLVDCGEINSTVHRALLSKEERKRVYG
jgi:hypothetical protein